MHCTSLENWEGRFQEKQTRDVDRSGRRGNRFLCRTLVTSFKFADVDDGPPPLPRKKRKKLYWHSLSLILSNGYHQFLTILNIFSTPSGIMQKLVYIYGRYVFYFTQNMILQSTHTRHSQWLYYDFKLGAVLKDFLNSMNGGNSRMWKYILYLKTRDFFYKNCLEYTVEYARSNALVSGTSFVIASVRSSIHWNIYLGIITSRPTTRAKLFLF